MQKKTNSMFIALMLRMSYTLNEETPETQNIREIRKETTFYLKTTCKLSYNSYDIM